MTPRDEEATPRPAAAATAPSPPDPQAMRRLFFRLFPAVALSMFAAALDQTIVATALPAIARELGEVERISWVVVLYLSAATIAAPVYGRLGDAFGRRNMLLVAQGVFIAGAMACALADSMAGLTAARLLQGFGGGGLISLSIALIGEVVPPRERGRFQAWIAAVFGGASAFGPVAGGFITEHLGWRAVFLIYLPLGLLAAWLAVTRLGAAAPGRRGGFRFDWPGLLLFAAFVGPALLALDYVRRFSPSAAFTGAALLALACASLWLLLRWERRAPDPLLPLGLLGEPSIWRTNLLTGCVSGATVGLLAFLPIYLQAVRGLSPGDVGLVLVPMSISTSLGALAAGRAMGRTGYTMLWPGIGLIAATLLLAVAAAGATGWMPIWLLPWILAAAALGYGTSFPMVQITVQVAAGRERLGTAAASVQFCRSIGAATGAAMMGAVLFGTLAAMGGEAAGLFVRLVNEGRAVLDALSAAERVALQAELAGAFRAAFGFAALLMAAAAYLAWRVPLRRV